MEAIHAGLPRGWQLRLLEYQFNLEESALEEYRKAFEIIETCEQRTAFVHYLFHRRLGVSMFCEKVIDFTIFDALVLGEQPN